MKVAMSSPKVACLQAAHTTAAKQQAEIESIRAYYKQQLDSARAQLQQQRQATATAQVASAGKAFACARLAAQLNNLRADLQEIKHKHQAATAEATALRNERAAALQACADESMHHRATKAALDVSVKELQASHAALGTLHSQLSSACKELKQQKQKATAALAAVQQRLSTMTQRMQLNRQAAAKASAAANASRFAAARTAAQHHTLKEELEQVRMQRDAAAALACDLSTQLQQANAGQQVAEQALAAHRRLHSAAITAMALAWNHDSCSAASSPAAHPAAATSPNAGCPALDRGLLADPDLQDSSDGLAPATPPRRTVSWCQSALSALSVLKLGRDWVGGFSSRRRRGSEGGFGGSTGSNSSSRDASSGGS
jgi:chromosome segregation ATPase